MQDYDRQGGNFWNSLHQQETAQGLNPQAQNNDDWTVGEVITDTFMAPFAATADAASSMANLGGAIWEGITGTKVRDVDIASNFDSLQMDTKYGQFLSGTLQFLIPYVGVGKLAGMTGALSKAGKLGKTAQKIASKPNKMTQAILNGTQNKAMLKNARRISLAKEAGKGAVVDMLAFETNENRLYDILAEATGSEAMLNSWMAYDEDDNVFEARIKNVLEGAAMGGLIDFVMTQYRAGRTFKKTIAEGGSEREAVTAAARTFDSELDRTLKVREKAHVERMSESNSRNRTLRNSAGDSELQQYDEQLNAWLEDVKQRGIEVGEDLREQNWRLTQEQIRDRNMRNHLRADTPMEMSPSERARAAILEAEGARSRRGPSDAARDERALKAAQEAGDTGDPRAAKVGTDDDFNPMEAPVRDDAARAANLETAAKAAEGEAAAKAAAKAADDEAAAEAAKTWDADFTYRDLQGVAREYGIPATGKREELAKNIQKAVKDKEAAVERANKSRAEIKAAIDERGAEAVPEGYDIEDFADGDEYIDIDGEAIDTQKLLDERLGEYDRLFDERKAFKKGDPEHIELSNQIRQLEEEIGEIRLQGDTWVPPHMKAPKPPEGVQVRIDPQTGKPRYELEPARAQKQAAEIHGGRIDERLKSAGLDLETLKTTKLDPLELMRRIKDLATRTDLPMNPRKLAEGEELPEDLSRRAANMNARTDQLSTVEGAHDLIRVAEINYKAQNFGAVLDEDDLRTTIYEHTLAIMNVDRAKRAALVDHLGARTKAQLEEDLAHVLTYGELSNSYAESVDDLLRQLSQHEMDPPAHDLELLADLFDTMRASQKAYSEGKSVFGYGLRAPLNQHRDMVDEAISLGRDACGLKT